MPYKVVKGRGLRPYKIVRLTDGKTVGSSRSRRTAEASIRARQAGKHGAKMGKGRR